LWVRHAQTLRQRADARHARRLRGYGRPRAAFPPGVQGDPGRGGVRIPLGLLAQRFLVNGVVAGGVLEREEGVNGLT